jgi:hypothetical protein
MIVGCKDAFDDSVNGNLDCCEYTVVMTHTDKLSGPRKNHIGYIYVIRLISIVIHAVKLRTPAKLTCGTSDGGTHDRGANRGAGATSDIGGRRPCI